VSTFRGQHQGAKEQIFKYFRNELAWVCESIFWINDTADYIAAHEYYTMGLDSLSD